MNKTKLIALTAAALTLGSIQSSAITYIDKDVHNVLLADGASRSGVFDIRVSDGDAGDVVGYDPALQSVVSAVASFYMRDDGNDAAEKHTIDLGGLFSTPQQDVQNTVEVITFFGTLLAQLNQSGSITYKVTAVDHQKQHVNDFIFEWAKLEVIATDVSQPQDDPDPVPVPDAGGTSMLIALGIGGLAFLRRSR